jgi:hypothetical protein
MRILSRLFAAYRVYRLGHQFRQIEQAIEALPPQERVRLGMFTLREIGQASRGDFPHLYGTPPELRYRPWGLGTDIGYARARSDNAEVALRGIALWLAVAYHETKDSPHRVLHPQHRHLLRVVRALKDLHGAGDPAAPPWQTSAAA